MIGIYKITNKINNKCYIGQSIHIEQRWQEHLYQHKESAIHKAFEKYGIENFTFEVLEECKIEELDDKEIKYIADFDSFKNGYNLTLGGKSNRKYDINEVYEDYLKTNNIAQTAKNFGCGRTTAINILRIFGINRSDLQEARAVKQIDPKTLEIIQIYDSIADAARAVNVTRENITNVLSGRYKSSKGYYWQYLDDNAPLKAVEKTARWKCSVIQIDPETNEVLQIFDSLTAASEKMGKGKSGRQYIAAVCQGKKDKYIGYKWKYKDECDCEVCAE